MSDAPTPDVARLLREHFPNVVCEPNGAVRAKCEGRDCDWYVMRDTPRVYRNWRVVIRLHSAHVAERLPALLDAAEELAALRRWKAEALPVMAGLQEVGHALGLPLGMSITGRDAVDAALDLRAEVEELAAMREAVEKLAEPPEEPAPDSDLWHVGFYAARHAIATRCRDILAAELYVRCASGGDDR